MKDIEVEIQVNIEKMKPLRDFLESKADFVDEKRELDEYYTPPHRNFVASVPVDEWLRLRDKEGAYTLNYKHWHRDSEGKTNHCTEHQTKIENIDSMRNILQVLGFKPIVKVDKRRRKYHYKEYEITLDKVVGLDETVEIEFKGESDKTPKEITAEMIKFLKQLRVGKIKRSYQGYPFLLLFPELAEYEEIS